MQSQKPAICSIGSVVVLIYIYTSEIECYDFGENKNLTPYRSGDFYNEHFTTHMWMCKCRDAEKDRERRRINKLQSVQMPLAEHVVVVISTA